MGMSALFLLAAACAVAQPVPSPRWFPKHVRILPSDSTNRPDVLASLLNKAELIAEPKVCATMLILPVNPKVDPKFVIKMQDPRPGRMPVFQGIPPCSMPNP